MSCDRLKGTSESKLMFKRMPPAWKLWLKLLKASPPKICCGVATNEGRPRFNGLAMVDA